MGSPRGGKWERRNLHLPINTNKSRPPANCSCWNLLPSFVSSKAPHACNLRCPAKVRSEEHTSELQSHLNLVCRLLLEKKNSMSFFTQLCQLILSRLASSMHSQRCF